METAPIQSGSATRLSVWVGWFLLAIALYVLSIGPVFAIIARSRGGHDADEICARIYFPVVLAMTQSPGIDRVVRAYVAWSCRLARV